MVIIENNEEGEMVKCKLVTDYKEMRFCFLRVCTCCMLHASLPSFLKENSSFLAKLQWGQISYTQYFGSSNHNHNKNMSDQ